ncbi:predicted protein [Naegleria gruberi]|uniref:Predicted protein n=1 Tax=Naegleria gruberi TaxID=5762 RepID=D2V8T6_NAEGR|nr:uncharacterized protein NAEGRDRAFT_47587 [Naegleria gruberi]EFC46858.1 predicted protein [Naegleria gruberi]|eukprot:XP_002679602.1 predicted protein [Naegleria gruberi strain NEG-M]
MNQLIFLNENDLLFDGAIGTDRKQGLYKANFNANAIKSIKEVDTLSSILTKNLFIGANSEGLLSVDKSYNVKENFERKGDKVYFPLTFSKDYEGDVNVLYQNGEVLSIGKLDPLALNITWVKNLTYQSDSMVQGTSLTFYFDGLKTIVTSDDGKYSNLFDGKPSYQTTVMGKNIIGNKKSLYIHLNDKLQKINDAVMSLFINDGLGFYIKDGNIISFAVVRDTFNEVDTIYTGGDAQNILTFNNGNLVFKTCTTLGGICSVKRMDGKEKVFTLIEDTDNDDKGNWDYMLLPLKYKDFEFAILVHADSSNPMLLKFALKPPVSCHGFKNTDSDVCSGNGECVAENICKCKGNFDGEKCEKCTAKFEGKYCSDLKSKWLKLISPIYHNHGIVHKCYGLPANSSSVCGGVKRGECLSENTCKCKAEYFGNECEHTYCFGVPSISTTGKVCGGKGACVDYNEKKMIPQTPADSKINHVNVVKEERIKRQFLDKIVKDFGTSSKQNQSNKFVKEAFDNYEKIYEKIEKGPEISIGLLSEPGFGKTSTLNMILSGKDDYPMKASSKFGSGETLFCTEIKYSDKLRLLKVYCSPKKYVDRIIRLSKKNEDNTIIADLLSSDRNEDQLLDDYQDVAADESPSLGSNEESSDDDDYNDEQEECILPRKAESNPVSNCGLDQSELKTCYAELLKFEQEGDLQIEFQVSDDKAVMSVFEKERLQSKERLLMVDKFVLCYNSEILKSRYGKVAIWDIPGYGEQNNSEILSMLIEEVISNCNVILKGLESVRQIVGVDCVPDLWTYKGLRYALQIATLYKSQFPIKAAVDARAAIKTILKETYFELSTCVKTLMKSIKRTEKKCRNIEQRQSEEPIETFSPHETLDCNIQSQLIEYDNWIEFTTYFYERNRKIRYRIDMYKNQMFEFIEKKIDSLMAKQKKDLATKEEEMNTFKGELVEIVDDIFHSMNFVSPNERIEDYGSFDIFYSILNSMKEYLSNCADELLHIRGQLESEEYLKLAIEKFKLIDDMRVLLKKEKTKPLKAEHLGLSNRYPSPACKSGKGCMIIPDKEYNTIRELKRAKVLSPSEKFGNVQKLPKSSISLTRVEKESIDAGLSEEQKKLYQKGQLVLMEIDRNEKQVLVSYEKELKETKLAKFKSLLSTDALIGTMGGNKSHSRQRIAPIFITTLPEYFEETSPNFLERHVHDCCIKHSKNGSQDYLIFIMVENAFLEKARSFLNEAMNEVEKAPNYVFVSIDTEIFINIGKKKKLCMLLAEHFELEIYHVMEDNFIHAEEYKKPIFVRHNNALARYLIFAEAIIYFELHSSYDYQQKEEVIKEFLTYVTEENPLIRSHYTCGKIGDSDRLRMFKTFEEFRKKCIEDPRELWTILEETKAHLTKEGKQILSKYKKLYNEKFDKRNHVGHVSLWNVRTAQSKFLSNEVDKLQKTTHFVSSARGNISTFYGPNMIGIHPVSDMVLFDGISSKDVVKKDHESFKEGNNSSDEYFIRQMLLYGIGGFQIYAFKYSGGLRKNANRQFPHKKLTDKKVKSPTQKSPQVKGNKKQQASSSSSSSPIVKLELNKLPVKKEKKVKEIIENTPTSNPTSNRKKATSSSISNIEKNVQSVKSGQASSSSSTAPKHTNQNRAASSSSSPSTNTANRKRKESDKSIDPPKKLTKR